MGIVRGDLKIGPFEEQALRLDVDARSAVPHVLRGSVRRTAERRKMV